MLLIEAFSRETLFGSKVLTKNFSVLMKCTNKFDCLILYKMFFIHELKPTRNEKSDSICAKVFNN